MQITIQLPFWHSHSMKYKKSLNLSHFEHSPLAEGFWLWISQILRSKWPFWAWNKTAHQKYRFSAFTNQKEARNLCCHSGRIQSIYLQTILMLHQRKTLLTFVWKQKMVTIMATIAVMIIVIRTAFVEYVLQRKS